MRSFDEIRESLRPYYFTDDIIAIQAYNIWETLGKPDGESLVPMVGWLNNLKNKDYHWMLAKSKIETVLNMDAEIYYDLERSSWPPCSEPKQIGIPTTEIYL